MRRKSGCHSPPPNMHPRTEKGAGSLCVRVQRSIFQFDKLQLNRVAFCIMREVSIDVRWNRMTDAGA